jgi:hypothetical protein
MTLYLGCPRGSSTAGSSLWDPAMLSGLVLRLRADTGVTQSAGLVSAWADLSSGSGITVTQATGGNQPTWLSNGWPNGNPCMYSPDAVRFMMTSVNAITIGVFSLFVVAKYTGNGEMFNFGSSAGGSNVGTQFYTSTGASCAINRGGSTLASNRDVSTNWALDATTPHQYAWTFDGTNAGSIAWKDGVAQAMTNLTTHDPGTSTFARTVTVLNFDGENLGAIGLTAEYLLFNRVVSSQEMGMIHAYSQQFWGTP